MQYPAQLKLHRLVPKPDPIMHQCSSNIWHAVQARQQLLQILRGCKLSVRAWLHDGQALTVTWHAVQPRQRRRRLLSGWGIWLWWRFIQAQWQSPLCQALTHALWWPRIWQLWCSCPSCSWCIWVRPPCPPPPPSNPPPSKCPLYQAMAVDNTKTRAAQHSQPSRVSGWFLY